MAKSRTREGDLPVHTIVICGSSGHFDLIKGFLCIPHLHLLDSDDYRKQIQISGKECIVRLLSSAGVDYMASMLSLLYQQGDGFVCVFSVANRGSFMYHNLTLRDNILAAVNQDVPFLFIGIRPEGIYDGWFDEDERFDEDKREVTISEAEALAKSWGTKYIEISPSTVDCNKILCNFAKTIMKRKEQLNKPVAEKELELALIAYKRAIKEGYISLINKKLVLMGPPCTGKTAFKALLFNWPPPKKHHSTPIASRPIRAIERITDRSEGKVWDIVEPSEVYSTLADAVKAKDDTSTDQNDSENFEAPMSSSEEESSDSDQEWEGGKVTSVNDITVVSKAIPSGSHASNATPIIDHSQQLFKRLEKSKKVKKSEALHKASWVHVLDSGGQPQFADISRAFLRGNAVNVITVKLTEKLSDKPNFTYSLNGKVMNAPSELQMTNMQLIEHFVRSVGVAKTTTIRIGNKVITTKPYFIIIGTHYDKATKGTFMKREINEETIADKNRQLLASLGEFHDHFIFFNEGSDELIFPVDNLCWLNRKKISAQIRHRIMSQKGIGYKVPIPIRWYLFELQIRELASQEEHGIISLQSCYEIGSKIKMNANDVRDSLVYYDSLTLCLYYNKLLPNIIFTNPQYLLDMLSNVVRVSFVASLEDILPKGRSLSLDDQRLLREDGVFKESLLDVLDLPFVPSLFTKADFLKLLQHIKVIAPLTSCSDSVQRYFMPIVLPPDQLHLTQADEKVFTATSDPIIIEFKAKIVPQGVFPSVVVSLVSRNEEPRFFIDSRSPTFSHQRRYAVKLYSEDLSGCVLLIDRITYIEIYFTGFLSGCPLLYSAIQNAVVSSGRLLGYDVNELEVAVSLTCQREDHRIANTPHSSKITYHQGRAYGRCTLETELAPLPLTDRQHCWLNEGAASGVSVPAPHLIPSTGVLNEVHGPVILSAIKEINIWEVLGIFLGLKYAVIEQIRRSNHHQVEPSRKDMIYRWIEEGTATSTGLITALENLGNRRAARELPLDAREFTDGDFNAVSNTLPEGILSEEHAPIILTVLYDLNDWEELGIYLNFTYPQLEQIRIENPNDVQTCRMIMIIKWLQKGSATRQAIISALELMNKNVLANKLQQLPLFSSTLV